MTKTSTLQKSFVLVAGASFSPESDHALDQASRIASRIPGCELHVVRAVATTVSDARVHEIADKLEAYMAEVSSVVGMALDHLAVHVRPGAASRVLTTVAREVSADMIVLGPRAQSLKSLFLGSVGRRVVAQATCPVVVASGSARDTSADDPVIEPACPDCVKTRAATSGTAWWCERHAEHHLHAHAYRYRRELSFEQHDSSLVPTGKS